MTADAASATSLPPDPPSDRAVRNARHLAMLAELAEIGMALARLVREAAAGTGGEAAAGVVERLGGGDPALAFSRISRAVRQTLLLEDHLAQEESVRAAEREKADARRRADDARNAATYDRAMTELRQQHVGWVFGRTLRETLGDRRAEPKLEALEAILDHPLELDELLRYSPGEMILRLARRLGVAIDWQRWGDESWAAEILAARIAPPVRDRESLGGDGTMPPADIAGPTGTVTPFRRPDEAATGPPGPF